MDARTVTKALAEHVYPALVAEGFERDGDRTLRRYVDNRIDIVDLHSLGRIQAERASDGATPASFGCRVATCFLAVAGARDWPVKHGRPAPEAGAGHLMTIVPRKTRQFLPNFGKEFHRPDLWLIAQPADVDVAIADLRAQWPRARKWFAQLERRDQVIARLQSPYEWRMSPHKWLLVGCLALEAGQLELVEPALQRVLETTAFHHLRDDLEAKIARAREQLAAR